MTEQDFRNEAAYQITMSFARKLLEEGVLTRNEYDRLEQEMYEKYRPSFGVRMLEYNLT